MPRPSPWDGIDRSSQPCVFFAQEKCTKGDSCPFSHANVGAGTEGNVQRSTQASHTSHTPQGSTGVSAGLIEARPKAPVASSAEARNGDGLHGGAAQTPKGSPKPAAASGSVPSPGSPPLMMGADGTMYVIGPDGPVALDAVIRTMGARAEGGAAPSGVSNQTKAENPSRNGQSHAPSSSSPAQNTKRKGDAGASLHTTEKAPSQGGVIALPDGGFITRKRAAEMHLRDGSGESQVRHVRRRELGNHDKPRPNRIGVPESRGTAAGGSRGSIMDRLGPAISTQDRSATADRVNAPSASARPTHGSTFHTAKANSLDAARQPQAGVPTVGRAAVPIRTRTEAHKREEGNAAVPIRIRTEAGRRDEGRAVAPTRIRTEAHKREEGRATLPIRIRTEAGKREEKRQHVAAPTERLKLSSQTPAPSALSTPQALGTARQSRRADGGREEGGGVVKTLGNSTSGSKSSSLNFKVPTLDEIKRKKAEAARGIEKATNVKSHQSTDGNRAGRPAENADVAPREVSSPDLAQVPPLAAEGPSRTILHAADLDEFSEWL